MRIIVVDPTEKSIAYREVEDLTLEMMQAIVGGYIEYVYHEKWLEDDFIINEEGLINHLTRWMLGAHIYCGPAIIVHNKLDDEGESHHSDPHMSVDRLWNLVQFKS